MQRSALKVSLDLINSTGREQVNWWQIWGKTWVNVKKSLCITCFSFSLFHWNIFLLFHFHPHFWKHTFRHSKQHPDSLVCLPSKFLCLSLTFSTWPRSIPFLRLKEKLSLSSPNHTESYLLIYLPVQWFGTVCRSIESNLCGFFTNYTCGPFL